MLNLDKIHTNPEKLETLYKFHLALGNDPKISVKKLHESYSHFSSRQSSITLFNYCKEKEIIIGPFLYCNFGLSVTFLKRCRSPLRFLDKFRTGNNPYIYRATALCGDYSFMIFSPGKNKIQYAESITPSFPGQKSIPDLTFIFDEKCNLPIDPYPNGWGELDWKIFHCMRDTAIPFYKVGSKLKVSWMTVKRHYEKILHDCKVMVAFFPLGQRGYDQILFVFQTDYEGSLRNSLQQLDRTSYLWKSNDEIILTVFTKFYNETCEKFKEMEENGLIRNLRISTPIRHHVSALP